MHAIDCGLILYGISYNHLLLSLAIESIAYAEYLGHFPKLASLNSTLSQHP